MSYELASSSVFLALKMKLYTNPATTPPKMGPAQYTCEHQSHHNFSNMPNLTQVMINHLITITTLKKQYPFFFLKLYCAFGVYKMYQDKLQNCSCNHFQ